MGQIWPQGRPSLSVPGGRQTPSLASEEMGLGWWWPQWAWPPGLAQALRRRLESTQATTCVPRPPALLLHFVCVLCTWVGLGHCSEAGRQRRRPGLALRWPGAACASYLGDVPHSPGVWIGLQVATQVQEA